MRELSFYLVFFLLFSWGLGAAEVRVGLDRVFVEEPFRRIFEKKNIGLVSHHAAISHDGKDSLQVFEENYSLCEVSLVMSPEHGFYGAFAAETFGQRKEEFVKKYEHISLYGLSEIPEQYARRCDLFVFDVQDIGVRSYTFIQVLLKVLKASERYRIPVVVLDRPNPMGGRLVDGPMAQGQFIPEIPYCHGMTIGEIALYFQAKYARNSLLTVVPMKGWRRSMLFQDTGLKWVPTSPQIPNERSAFFYAATGVIGHLSLANIGVGYTLPFQVVGAPWIQGEELAAALNQLQLPGVMFYPYRFEPFFGKFKMEECKGVYLILTDPHKFLPVETQFALLSVLKKLYFQEFRKAMSCYNKIPCRKKAFASLIGREDILEIIEKKPYILWPLKEICLQGRKNFLEERKPFLISEYGD